MIEENIIQEDITQTIEQTIVQRNEIKFSKILLARFSAVAAKDGVIQAMAQLVPVTDDGVRGKTIMVAIPDVNALAAQQPGVSAVLEGLKSVVVAVAKAQGKI